MATSTDTAPHRRPAQRLRLIRLFGRSRDGATAIEFSFLALPFLMLLFAVIENAIAFTTQQLLSNAADNTARQFRTGQIDLKTMTKQKLQDHFCSQIKIMFAGCDKLIYTLKAYPNFAAVASNIEWEGNQLKQTQSIFEPGGSADKISLQLYYKYPVRMDIVRMAIAGTDYKLLYTTTTWQNEAY